MSILKKAISIFQKTKATVVNLKTKAQVFIIEHKAEIKVLMKVLQFLYERGNGQAKMKNVVKTVSAAIGVSEEQTMDIANVIQTECQKIYDELLASGELNK